MLRQTLGTAACRVKLLMSESLELEAVSVTVRPESDCFSQLSVKVTPLFSYTVTAGAKKYRREKEEVQMLASHSLICI